MQQIAVPLQHPDDQQLIDHYRVVLFIDGFVVRIQRPDGAGDAFFCGRHGKSCDSLNVQYVTDIKGRVWHVITGLSDATHDKTAAGWSVELWQFLGALPDDYVMHGDAAYQGLHEQVVTPVVGRNLTAVVAFGPPCVI